MDFLYEKSTHAVDLLFIRIKGRRKLIGFAIFYSETALNGGESKMLGD